MISDIFSEHYNKNGMAPMKIFFLTKKEFEGFKKDYKKNFIFLNVTESFEIEEVGDGKIFKSSINKSNLLEEYNEFIGNLNKKYHSINWWATTIASKNLYVSNLYKNIYKYLQFDEAIKKVIDSDPKKPDIVVIIENDCLKKQMIDLCNDYGIEHNLSGTKVRTGWGLDRSLQLLRSNMFFLKDGWKKKRQVNKLLKKTISKELKKSIRFTVLRTWIDKRNFNKSNDYTDQYFGRLKSALNEDSTVITLAGILSDYNNNIKKIRDVKSEEIIIPQEYFIDYLNYLSIFFGSMKKKLRSFEKITFKGLRIDHLVRGELEDNLLSRKFLNNLLYFYTVKNLSRRVRCESFIFPFENHSWEKMTVLALRKYSPTTKIVGYQHSHVPRNELSYFPTAGEQKILPLPDRIVTTGRHSKSILEKYGNYPHGMIQTGPALRYEYLFNYKIRKRIRNNKILIALSIDKNSAFSLIQFIIKAFKGEGRFSITLRCHPLMPIETILKAGYLNLPGNFQIEPEKDLADALNDADMVIYSGTTVCIEALMMGVPVIHADINRFYNSDPLFECEHLKWSVRKPGDLLNIIDRIYKLDNMQFKKEQDSARNYVENYFHPVSKTNLKKFIIK